MRLQESGLKLKLSKCTFMRKEITYLCHLVTTNGIHMDPKKQNVIKEYPAPKNKDKWQSFMGLMAYYRSLIKNFSIMAEPLNKLLRKNDPYDWTEDQQNSFELLKAHPLEPPLLRYPDYRKLFYVATDASNTDLGASLLQESEGKLQPIAYASRTLNKSERNYSVTKREGLAVVWGLRHFQFILLGYELVVLTYH